jgi:hypothetical protein
MAEVKVNEGQWNSLPEDEQNRIREALVGTGAMRSEDVIVGDPNVPEFTGDTVMEPMWNPIKDICKAGCDIAAASAAAWCTANTAGLGLAACLAAAEAAREACRGRC